MSIARTTGDSGVYAQYAQDQFMYNYLLFSQPFAFNFHADMGPGSTPAAYWLPSAIDTEILLNHPMYGPRGALRHNEWVMTEKKKLGQAIRNDFLGICRDQGVLPLETRMRPMTYTPDGDRPLPLLFKNRSSAYSDFAMQNGLGFGTGHLPYLTNTNGVSARQDAKNERTSLYRSMGLLK